MSDYKVECGCICERYVCPKGVLKVGREVEVIDYSGIMKDMMKTPVFWLIFLMMSTAFSIFTIDFCM